MAESYKLGGLDSFDDEFWATLLWDIRLIEGRGRTRKIGIKEETMCFMVFYCVSIKYGIVVTRSRRVLCKGRLTASEQWLWEHRSGWEPGSQKSARVDDAPMYETTIFLFSFCDRECIINKIEIILHIGLNSLSVDTEGSNGRKRSGLFNRIFVTYQSLL